MSGIKRPIQEAYKAHREAIMERLRLIEQAVKKHEQKFKENPDWGFIGDIAHVNNHLSELDSFSKSKSKIK